MAAPSCIKVTNKDLLGGITVQIKTAKMFSLRIKFGSFLIKCGAYIMGAKSEVIING